MFILSSISRGLGFWSISHTSTYGNSELKDFKNTKFAGEAQIYYEEMYTRLLESCW